MILATRDLSVGIRRSDGTVPLLQGLDLTVRRGDIVVLRGPSGSGKTTLLKAIMGVLDLKRFVVSGKLLYFSTSSEAEATEPEAVSGGATPYNADDHLLRRFGGTEIRGVLQGPETQLSPFVSVWKQLKEAYRREKGPERRALMNSTLETLGLASRDLRRVGRKLSQGQQQRALLACALLPCRLLVLDEPSSALDPERRRRLFERIAKDVQSGRIGAAIISTHESEVLALRGSAATLKVQNLRQVEESRDEGEASPSSVAGNGSLGSHQFDRRTTRRTFEAPASNCVPADEPVLRIRELSQGYGGAVRAQSNPVVHGFDLDVYQGEIVGIRGESGRGKSTILNATARILDHTRGSVYYRASSSEWVDLVRLQPDGAMRESRRMRQLRAEIQLIPQYAAAMFDPEEKFQNAFRESCTIAGVDFARWQRHELSDLLYMLGFRPSCAASLPARYPHEVSGGERQRLGVLRALIVRPRLLLADEITSDLDPGSKTRIGNALRDCLGDEASVICASHDRRFLDEFCDRVVEI